MLRIGGGWDSVAKLEPVFWVQSNFRLNFWVKTVGPQDPKRIQSGRVDLTKHSNLASTL